MIKAKIIVRLKEGVLDPQGQTIQRALNKMGHPEITNLRQGKYFEVEIDGLENKETVRQLMEELSRDVLCNPIIESFEIEDIW